MKIVLNARSIVKSLSLFTIVLILLHSIILGIYYYVGDPEKFGFIRMFDLDMERNVPTLFSSTLMLIAAFLFYLLSKSPKEINKKNKSYCLGLYYIFTFLAFDESAKIHEKLGDFTENFLEEGGYLHYPWVIS